MVTFSLFIVILTIVNSLFIAYLVVFKTASRYLSFSKETTMFDNTLLGYRLSLWEKTSEFSSTSKHSIYFKIRDKKKTEKNEEILRMIGKYSYQQKRQTLSAKFSWLKTIEQVNQFEKDYSVVDNKIVSDLVYSFKHK